MNTGESWKWDPAPGYDPRLHQAMPYQLACVPVMHTVMVESGRILNDTKTAFISGRNREVLQSHASWLQTVVDSAAQAVPGFHRSFVIEAHKIPDLPQIPPPETAMFEVLASPASLSLAPSTKTGKAPKFPLSVSFVIEADVLVRPDGFFVHVVTGTRDKGDSTIAHLGYLSDGVLGKASVHCWRGPLRWSVDCVTRDGGIIIARIERGELDGTATRFCDYNA